MAVGQFGEGITGLSPYHGLAPVRRVALSFTTLGAELCKVLIAKRETGVYPLPLQRKV
jgi:hypothetical protein